MQVCWQVCREIRPTEPGWLWELNWITGSRAEGLGFTSTPKVCKIMAFMAVIMGLGLLFCILFEFR